MYQNYIIYTYIFGKINLCEIWINIVLKFEYNKIILYVTNFSFNQENNLNEHVS